jgi:amidase
MLGCVGVAVPSSATPDGQPIHAGYAGRHGGNLDQKVVTAGTTLFLPVFVEGALLYIGDVHAAQGDGELSGTAIEIGSMTRVRVDVIPGAGTAWPWLETSDRWIVLTADNDFVVARREAVEAVVSLLERDLGVEPAEALALLAGAGDLRIGQSMGGAIPMTLRLEIPKWAGVNPMRSAELAARGGRDASPRAARPAQGAAR